MTGSIDKNTPTPRLELFSREKGEIASWLRAPEAPGLVVCGPAGAGKSELVRDALAVADYIRIECLPGVSAGEVLCDLGHALLGRGDERLQQALYRESPFGLQLEVAKETLCRTTVGVWIEDIDFLGQGPLGHFGSQQRESRELLEVCSLAVSQGLRLLLTAQAVSTMLPGPGRFKTVVLPPLEAPDLDKLWAVSCPHREVFPPQFKRPLEVRIAGLIAAAGEAVDEDCDLAALFRRVWELLSDKAQRLLTCCALSEGRVTRGFVRYLERESACEAGALEELLRWRMLVSAGETDSRLHLNPALLSLAKEAAADAGQDFSALQKVLGDYWKYTGRRAHRFWDLLRAAELYTRAECLDEAHELQREVVEDLLRRDYLDLGEEILSRTVAKAAGRTRAVALGNLAIVRKNQGDHDSALKLYEEARHQFEELEDQPNVARVLHQLGNTYYLKGDMETALRHYDLSRKAAQSCGDEAVAAAAQVQTANVLFLRGELDEATRYYAESLEAATRLSDRRMELAVLLQLGQVHYTQEALLEAEDVLKRAGRLAEEQGDSVSVTKALQFRGLVARSRRDLEMADRLFAEAQRLGGVLRDPTVVATSLYHRGSTKLEQGDLLSALRYAAGSAALFARNDRDEVRAAWAMVRDIAGRVGEDRFAQLAKQADVEWVLADFGGAEADGGS